MAAGLCSRCGEVPPTSGGYCRPCNAAWARNARAKARNEVLAHYGPGCACCGETEPVFLAVDHMDESGAEHRRSITGRRRSEGGGGCPSIALWLKREGFPPGFQILCHNCNWAKSRGGCPHNKENSNE